MVLTGCTAMNSSFDCPKSKGMMCKRIDQVNAMVDQGEIDTSGQPSSAAVKTSADDTPKPMPSVHPVRNNSISFGQQKEEQDSAGNYSMPYPEDKEALPGKPLRYGETVMRLWLAPFEDTQDNYHSPSMIYAVVKPGHWIGQPVKAIKD